MLNTFAPLLAIQHICVCVATSLNLLTLSSYCIYLSFFSLLTPLHNVPETFILHHRFEFIFLYWTSNHQSPPPPKKITSPLSLKNNLLPRETSLDNFHLVHYFLWVSVLRGVWVYRASPTTVQLHRMRWIIAQMWSAHELAKEYW
jgi:hypothetical protein